MDGGDWLQNNVNVPNATELCQLKKKIHNLGSSLVVQWLRIHIAMQGMQVLFLVGEGRSHMPRSN